MSRETGEVRDQRTLCPIAGAKIFVLNQDGTKPVITSDDGAVLFYATSDDYGFYYYNVADGTYDVKIYYGGLLLYEVIVVSGQPGAKTLAQLAQGLPDEANNEAVPSPGSGLPYLSAGVLKFA